MTNEYLHRLRAGAISEARKLFQVFIYLWVLFTLFSLHTAIILHDEHLSYDQGFALINAFALAKVMLIAEDLHIAERFRNGPLIYPIIFKSAVFAAILFCFHVIEQMTIGVLHGKTLSHSIPDIGGGTLRGMLMVGIIMFVVLIPFFAFRELERVIGPQELSRLLFGGKTNSAAAPLSHIGPKDT